MAENSVKFDISKLDELVKSLKDDYTLRVGIIGSKATKQHGSSKAKSDITNAELGTFHEFGTKKMPRRSFLEDSLKFKLKFDTEKMKEFRKLLFLQFFIKNSPKTFLQGLGAECLRVISEAFETNGWGMWKPLTARTEEAIGKKHKTLTMEKASKKSIATFRKSLRFWGNRTILTETGEMRDSISFKVFKK